jgi:hypothetical protein
MRADAMRTYSHFLLSWYADKQPTKTLTARRFMFLGIIWVASAMGHCGWRGGGGGKCLTSGPDETGSCERTSGPGRY